jgi:N-hydroxyarylamine O-acetyltransferase
MMGDPLVQEYLARIGARRPARAEAAALRELQHRHLLSVPFENLSIHLGERIALDEQALLEKLIRRRRGGFCYELNGAFAALLTALGYEVKLLAARVFMRGRWGPLFDHLALQVTAPDPWLVDVGFGDFSHYPLRLDTTAEQADPAGRFRVVTTDYGDLEVWQDGAPQYRLEVRPRELVDFEPTCWWQQTSPASHFTRSMVCSLLTETGRVTISNRRLVLTGGGERHEQPLESDDEVLEAYRSRFGIALDAVPVLARPAG